LANIVIVGPVPPYRGGISHYNQLLLSALRSEGHTTHVISYKRMYPRFIYPGKSDKEPEGEGMNDEHVYYCLDSLNPFTWLKALRIIRKCHADVVVFPWWTAFWSVLISTLCLGLRLRRKRPRILFLCHNIYDHEGGRLKNTLTRLTLKQADTFFVHSKKHRKTLISLMPGKRALFHPMPVFKMFPSDRKLPEVPSDIPRKRHIGLFFGFIRPYKGVDILLQAVPLILHKVPDFHLVVAGEAMWDLQKKYAALVEELNIRDHVTFHWRYIPGKMAESYFRSADVLILPYRRASGSALITLGYHYEVPVIATRTGNFEEIIEHGKNGYVVEPENIQSLAHFVIQYFTKYKKKEFVSHLRGSHKTGDWKTVASMIVTGKE